MTLSAKDMRRLFDLEPDQVVDYQCFNVAPMTEIPVVIKQEGKRSLEFFRWGLVPSWADDEKMGSKMINARAETLLEKSAYREAFNQRRCLIPADGFFEWREEQGKKQPYFFHMANGEPMALAGLWESKKTPDGELRTCTIITTEPNEAVRPFHDRMPAVLRPEEFEAWLSGESGKAILPLLAPISGDELDVYPVTQKMNRTDYEAPDAVQPLKPDQTSLF